jgi:hypothetical protein
MTSDRIDPKRWMTLAGHPEQRKASMRVGRHAALSVLTLAAFADEHDLDLLHEQFLDLVDTVRGDDNALHSLALTLLAVIYHCPDEMTIDPSTGLPDGSLVVSELLGSIILALTPQARSLALLRANWSASLDAFLQRGMDSLNSIPMLGAAFDCAAQLLRAVLRGHRGEPAGVDPAWPAPPVTGRTLLRLGALTRALDDRFPLS